MVRRFAVLLPTCIPAACGLSLQGTAQPELSVDEAGAIVPEAGQLPEAMLPTRTRPEGAGGGGGSGGSVFLEAVDGTDFESGSFVHPGGGGGGHGGGITGWGANGSATVAGGGAGGAAGRLFLRTRGTPAKLLGASMAVRKATTDF